MSTSARVRWRPLIAAASVLALWLLWVFAAEAEGPMRVAAEPRPALPTAAGFIPPTQLQASDETPAAPSGSQPPAPASATTSTSADPTGPIPAAGSGTWRLASGSSAVVGTGPLLVRYSVEIEDEVPLDAAAVAARIDQILGDERSWIGLGRWTLQRVDADADARIVVATPATVDRLCAPLLTSGKYSCRNGGYVVLNAARWAEGADSWGDDIQGYRGYLVNHEFGHYLGFAHTTCPAAGAPSPVMVQQTKSLFGCAPNAWPVVTGG